MSDVIVYNDGEVELKVSVDKETVWLTQKQLGELFGVTISNINMHIKAIFSEEELLKNRTIQKHLIVQKEGNREVKRSIEHYSLDMIISLGYRVNSKKATKFRQWATSVLKNYIQSGFAINSHKMTEYRLSNLENDVAVIKTHIKSQTLELKQGLFYNGQIFDAYVLVSELVKSAKKSIILMDNYIDESILILFAKNSNIEITIYTSNISDQLRLDIQKYNKQYKNLQVKTTKSLHDRFLICDDTIYHFGASLKDLGNKIFAVNKIAIPKHELLKNL